MLAAMFARLRASQGYIRGTQRVIKGTDYYVGATEDLFKKKYPQTRAWLKVGSAVTGFPQQIIRAGVSAQKAAEAARKAQALAEAQKHGAELIAKGLPFPALGKGRPGPGTLVPPKELGYKKWTGAGEHQGMWLPPAMWEKMHKEIKRGRPPKIKKEHKKKIKAALRASAEAQKAMKAKPKKLRRVIETGKI